MQRPSAVFGLAFAALWFLVEFFGRWSLNYRDDQLRTIENELVKGHSALAAIRLCQTPWYLHVQGYLSKGIIVVFILAWLRILCHIYAYSN